MDAFNEMSQEHLFHAASNIEAVLFPVRAHSIYAEK
jgi:hypothetical protein